jgi:excinuclease UvrABC nuclease subunit
MIKKQLPFFGKHLFHGWRKELQLSAGSGCGVYFAYNNKKLLYIGKSKCLYKRLIHHNLYWKSVLQSEFPTHFELIYCENIEIASKLEATLIFDLNPPLNRKQETKFLHKKEFNDESKNNSIFNWRDHERN